MDHSKLLKDDDLLLVFELLPLAALLQARMVCRRWRALALDARVWRQRVMDPSEDDYETAAVALRVAPRLRSLTIRPWFFMRLLSGVREAILLTKCQVVELTMHYCEFCQGKDCIRYHCWLALVLQRQVEVSWEALRRVALIEVDPARVVALVELALRANLHELELILLECGHRSSGKLSDQAALGSATLRALRFDSNYEPPLVLQPLLRAHKATLESLAVSSIWFGGEEELLASCSQLRRVELSIDEANAKVLAALPASQITDLTLTDPGARECFFDEFFPFFRKLTQLRRLSLPLYLEGGLLAALRALADVRNSCLEELSVGHLGNVSWASLLAQVRKGLPQLRSLYVESIKVRGHPGDHSLAAVLPPKLPNLQVLRVGDPCLHIRDNASSMTGAICGLPLLRGLVRRNPQLHVLGLSSKSTCTYWHRSYAEVDCGCCALGPHPATYLAVEHFSLCGHAEGEQCCLPAHRARPDKCPCSPDCNLPHTWLHVI